MQWHEIALKLSADALLTGTFIYALGVTASYLEVGAAFALAHTCNWLLNGHFFVLTRYIYPVPREVSSFEKYVKYLHQKAAPNEAIDGLAVFGSYCRNALHENSDLDVRVIAAPGVSTGLRVAGFCAKERFLAFFRRFPLDIYGFTDIEYLNRLRDDEAPLVLMDRSGRLLRRYPEATTEGA